MKMEVKADLSGIRRRLPKKKIQDFWIKSICVPRMKKYMPARDKQEPEKQLLIGANTHKDGMVTIKGPQMQYLYYGKVMAGKPKRATGKDLHYTKTINRQAGAFWDKALKQNELKQMEKELERYVKTVVKK